MWRCTGAVRLMVRMAGAYLPTHIAQRSVGDGDSHSIQGTMCACGVAHHTVQVRETGACSIAHK